MLLALSVISAQGAALGPTAYKVFDERGGSIGRVESNDWILPDPQKIVSSRHASVRCAGGAFYLEDTSTNGTFLNAQTQQVPKQQPAKLSDGDRIFIGDYEILVQLIDDAAQSGLSALVPDAALVPPPIDEPVVVTPSGIPDDWDHTGFPRGAPPASPPPRVPAPLQAAPGDAQELLLALGIDPSRVDPAVYRQLGAIIRIVVQGLIDVLQSRAEVKNSFRMQMTSIRPVENNPLKFSMNADDALHNLFVKKNPGYLPPVEAFEEGFRDVAFHQMAMLEGIRTAFNAMLAKFHPDHLESLYERKLRRTALIAMGNRLRYWDMYRTQFEDIERDREAHFQLLFGEEFAKAYHEQMQKLTASRHGPR